MSVRTNRRRRFEFEALERRETPTAGVGGGIQALAHHAKPIALKGNGTATLDPNTGTGSIQGNSALLGQFTGTIDNATLVLTAADGSLLDLNALAKTGKVHRGTKSVSGKFTITGGTNEFNSAMGGGTISGTLNVATDTLNFKINGKLTG